MVLLEPALATGAILAAAFTVTCIVSLPVAPLLSVTFNSNLYTPCTNPVTVVAEEAALVIVPAEGPDIFVQLYEDMLPSASVPLPANDVVLTGNVMVLLEPALATGAMLEAAFTVTCIVSLPVAPLLSVAFNSNW